MVQSSTIGNVIRSHDLVQIANEQGKLTAAKPEYSGYHFLAAAISPENPTYSSVASLVGPGAYIAAEAGKQILAQGLGDGSYNIYAGLCLPEHWGKENPLVADSSQLRQSLLQTEFADWAPVNTDLIKRSDGDFHPWPLYAMPPGALSWESVPDVTLIGDAAHVRYVL